MKKVLLLFLLISVVGLINVFGQHGDPINPYKTEGYLNSDVQKFALDSNTKSKQWRAIMLENINTQTGRSLNENNISYVFKNTTQEQLTVKDFINSEWNKETKQIVLFKDSRSYSGPFAVYTDPVSGIKVVLYKIICTNLVKLPMPKVTQFTPPSSQLATTTPGLLINNNNNNNNIFIPGPPGRDGLPGAKGEKGDKGDPAPVAEVAKLKIPWVPIVLVSGASGYLGSLLNKPKGLKGDKGDTGIKGDKGDPGLKGDKGDKGDDGDPGKAGNPGEKGEKGDKGDPGSSGATGGTGAKGEKGDKGDKGETGDKGQPGDKGQKGDPGDKGQQGDKGQPGDKGQTGDKGPGGTPLPGDNPSPGGTPLSENPKEKASRVGVSETVYQSTKTEEVSVLVKKENKLIVGFQKITTKVPLMVNAKIPFGSVAHNKSVIFGKPKFWFSFKKL